MRSGIKHLWEINKNKEYSEYIKKNPIIKKEDISLKIDGANLTFGYDFRNDFFIESARSGRIYVGLEFINHSLRKKGIISYISTMYCEIFYKLKENKELNNYLRDNSLILEGEILYNRLGTEYNENYHKFVSIPYDIRTLGTELTFVISKIYKNEIELKFSEAYLEMQTIKSLSTNEYKFEDKYIPNQNDIDLSGCYINEWIKNKISSEIHCCKFGPYNEGYIIEHGPFKYKIILNDYLIFREDY